jgi:hypothetical protein
MENENVRDKDEFDTLGVALIARGWTALWRRNFYGIQTSLR